MVALPVFLLTFTLVAARQNPGTGVEPSWVPSPDGRGTIDIILSCVLTLGLCVWTAVHCDIVPNSTEWQRIFYKASWMFVALLAPEIVVSCSFCQWREAKKLHKYWCDEFKIEAGSEEDLMGLEGGMFVIMGGFLLERNDESPSTSSVVTVEGFKKLLKNTMIFDEKNINKKSIADKGKADVIAKTLVCVQASWMVIQVIGRKVDGLPVTLLEIHVIIQVFMTFLMYWFWWYKPLDVGEPILLEGVEVAIDALKDEQAVPKRLQSIIITDGPPIIAELLGLATQNDGAGILTAVMCLIYGGTHATAWNDHFPTPLERLFWRMSCTVLALGPWVQLTATALTAHFPVFRRCLREHIEDKRGWRVWLLWQACVDGYNPYVQVDFGMFAGTLFAGLCILYMFSIGYVTVEAFISIRSLPKGSYLTVNWEDYWPHL